jgi:hypothetical protein
MSGFKKPVTFNSKPVSEPKSDAELRSIVVSLQHELNDVKAKSNKIMLELERAVIGNITQVVNNVLSSGSVSIVSASTSRFGTQSFTGSGTKTVTVSPAATVSTYTIIGFVTYTDGSLSPFVTTSSNPISFTVEVSDDCSIAWISLF